MRPPVRPIKKRCTAYAKNFSKKYCVKRSKNRKCVAYRRMYKVSKCLKYKVFSTPVYHRTHRVFVVKRYRAVIANQKKAYLAAKARWTKSCGGKRLGRSLVIKRNCQRMYRLKLAKRRSFLKWRREFRYRLRAYRTRRDGKRFYKYRAQYRICKKKMIIMSKNAHVRAQMNAANKARKARLHRKYKNIMSIQDVSVRHHKLSAFRRYKRHSRRSFQKKWSKKIAQKCGCLNVYLKYNRARITYRRRRISRRRNTGGKRCIRVRKANPTYLRSSVKPACRGRRLRRIRPRKVRRSRVTAAQIKACFVTKKAGVVNKTLRKVCAQRTSTWTKTVTPFSCISRSHKHVIRRCVRYAVRRGRVVCTQKTNLFGTKVCLKNMVMVKRIITGSHTSAPGGNRRWIRRERYLKKRQVLKVKVAKSTGRKLSGIVFWGNIKVPGHCQKSKIIYPTARCVKKYRHNGVKFCSHFKFYRPTSYCKRKLSWKRYGKTHSGCIRRGIFYGRKYNKVVCSKTGKIIKVSKGKKCGCKVVRKAKYAKKVIKFECQKCKAYNRA